MGSLLTITPADSAVLVFLAIVLLTVSFLLSGSEVAFFSLTYKDIDVLKNKQQPAFRRIVVLLEQPKTLLATMLIANSLVNICLILIANTLINGWFSSFAGNFAMMFAIKVIVVSALLLLFAEILPKVWATQHKIWFASTASLVVEIFNSLFIGVARRLVRQGDRIERKFSPGSSAGLDNDDLDDAIDLLPEHEATLQEKQMLKGIRKFSETPVKRVMRTRLDVSGINRQSTLGEVIARVEELHYSRLPVFEKDLDEVVGVLHTKDLLPFLNTTQESGFDWHTLIRPPFFVHEHKLIEDLLQEFRNRRIHFAVVVDEFGGTSGIVTLEDIMEEIIGEIRDEFDEDDFPLEKISDHEYLFDGKIMINDVCRALKIPSDSFDEIRGDSDSLAGLVLEIAGAFPSLEEKLVHDNYTFVPVSISKNRIDKVRLIINPNG